MSWHNAIGPALAGLFFVFFGYCMLRWPEGLTPFGLGGRDQAIAMDAAPLE